MSGEATVATAAEVAPSLEESASEAPANPRLVALHRAVRAAIVIPATFAITLLVIGGSGRAERAGTSPGRPLRTTARSAPTSTAPSA